MKDGEREGATQHTTKLIDILYIFPHNVAVVGVCERDLNCVSENKPGITTTQQETTLMQRWIAKKD